MFECGLQNFSQDVFNMLANILRFLSDYHLTMLSHRLLKIIALAKVIVKLHGSGSFVLLAVICASRGLDFFTKLSRVSIACQLLRKVN